MARTTVPLTLDLLAALDPPSRACLFWEREPVRRRHLTREEAIAEKEAWISEVLREWGSCGRVVVVDGLPVGFLSYAPAAFVPGAANFPTAPVSPDAVLLMTAWVREEYGAAGIGRLLIQGMARDLVGREGIKAVEAFAKVGSGVGLDDCVLPADFLARVGFKTYRPHPRTPRMRVDLRTTLTWRDEMEAAWSKLRGVVRPQKSPTPAHREW